MKYFIVFALVLMFAFPSFAGKKPPTHHSWFGWWPFAGNKGGPGCTHVSHPSKKIGGKPVISCEQAPYGKAR